MEIRSEIDFGKLGNFLKRSKYEVINVQCREGLKGLPLRRIRRGVHKSYGEDSESREVNLYISMSHINVIQLDRLYRFVQKENALDRKLQIYIEKQEQKQWTIDSLSISFNYNEDSIYYHSFDLASQIGHKFLRSFWNKYFQSNKNTPSFDYQQELLPQLSKLQPLLKRINSKNLMLTQIMARQRFQFEGFDQKKEPFYPRPTQLWSYFYSGLMGKNGMSSLLVELQVTYELCGYGEDNIFISHVLKDIESLTFQKKIEIVFKLKSNLHNSVNQKDLNSGNSALQQILECVTKTKIQHISISVLYKTHRLSYVQLIYSAQIKPSNPFNIENDPNNSVNIHGHSIERVYVQFKHDKKSIDQLMTILSFLEKDILIHAVSLRARIEQLDKLRSEQLEQLDKQKSEQFNALSSSSSHQSNSPVKIYQLLFRIISENKSLKDFRIFFQEDVFHLNLKKKASRFSARYVESNCSARLVFSCADRSRSLSLLLSLLAILFSHSQSVFISKYSFFPLNNSEGETEQMTGNNGLCVQNSLRKPHSFHQQGEGKEIIYSDELLEKEKVAHLIECKFEVECVDRLDRYEHFLSTEIADLITEQTNKLAIAIHDISFIGKRSANEEIQLKYRKMFEQFLSFFQDWPRQTVCLQIFERKINQYTVHLGKRYFQICFATSLELINIEMNICSREKERIVNKKKGQKNIQRIIESLEAIIENNGLGKKHIKENNFEFVKRMTANIVRRKHKPFKEDLQKMLDALGGRVQELHCQYHSIENEEQSDSVIANLLHLNTNSVAKMYVSLNQQKNPLNINKDFFNWLEIMLKNRSNVKIDLSLQKDFSSKSSNGESFLKFSVQDVELIFNTEREIRIQKWLNSNSPYCDNEILNVISNQFSKSVDSITSIGRSSSNIDNVQELQNQFDNRNIEEFQVSAKNSLARIRVSDSNPSSLKQGLCLMFGSIFAKVKRIEVKVNPKSFQLQVKFASAFRELKELQNLELHFESNPQSSWNEYTLLEHLNDFPAQMIQIFLEDDEKQFKFLDQSKRVLLNLLHLQNLTTLSIIVKPKENPQDQNSSYKFRHFEFLAPFQFIPSKLIRFQLNTPHKQINEHFLFNKRRRIILAIKALANKKLFRKEIIMEIFTLHV